MHVFIVMCLRVDGDICRVRHRRQSAVSGDKIMAAESSDRHRLNALQFCV